VWFNKLGGALQQSGPVKAFDAKYEEIKNKIASENPKLAEAFGKYKQFADNNPKLQKFLLVIATSAAAALGLAVVGGASAGIAATGLGVGAATAIVQIADRLLKGEKASTAIGRGATAGIVAGVTAAGVKAAVMALDQLGAITKIKNSFQVEFNGKTAMVNAEDYKAWKEGFAAAEKIADSADFMSNADAYFAAANQASVVKAQVAAEILAKAADPAYQEATMAAAEIIIRPGAIESAVAAMRDAAAAINPVIAAAAGQAAGGAGEKKESYYVQQRPLSEGQVYLLLKRVAAQEQLTEGPVWDKVKSGAKNFANREIDAAKSAVGMVGKGLGAVGKQITNKNTYEKLWASWKLEGSPTDSEELAKFLKGQGVSDEVVAKVYGDMKIPAAGSAPAAAAVDIETVKQMIAKLPVDRKARLLTYLLGGKKAAGKAPAAAPEENPNIVKGTESKVHKGQKL
jgi:ABC-type multidrug transport system fused ATPase/permease subunit